MNKLTAIVLSLTLSAGLILDAQVAAQAADQVPAGADQLRASLPEIKKSILSATGYEAGAMDLNVTQTDLVVTLINSKLASGSNSARKNEAAKIAGEIADAISGKQALEGIIALHIDYVTRQADGNMRTVDKIDFRKDPQGRFKHHIS